MDCFFVGMCCHAQEIITKNLDELTNLPDDEFYDAFQDSKGQYWFCADSGLYRFDGINFIQYTNPKQRSQSLFNLKEDLYGRIWCNSLNGQFFVVNPDTDTLDFFIDVSDQLIGKLPKYELHDTQLIVKLDSGKLYQYDFDTKEKSILVDSVGTYTNTVKVKNQLYFFKHKDSAHHLHNFNLKTRTAKIAEKRFQFVIPEIFKVADNTIYVLLKNEEFRSIGLYKLNGDELTHIRFPKELNIEIYDMNKGPKESLYFGTNNGVIVMKEIEGMLVPKFSLLQGMKVSKIMIDTFGNYIFTTLNQGIHYWDGQENFKYEKQQSKLKSNNLQYIKRWNDSTVLVTDYENNIYAYKIDNQLQFSNHWKLNQEINHLFVTNDKAYAISDEQYFTRIDSTLKPLNNFKFSSIKDITFHEGSFYVGHSYRLEKVENLEQSTQKVMVREKRCAAVTSFDSKLYATFTDGSYIVKNDTLIPITYEGKILYADRLLAGNTFVWAIRKNRGVFYGKQHTFEQLTTLESNNAIIKNIGRDIYVLEAGKLYRINEKTRALELIKDVSYQIKNVKVVDFEVFKNVCILTTNKGLFQISLQKNSIQNTTAKTFIERILINETPKELANVQTLSHNENSVKIFLKNTDFAGRDAYTYRYKINDEAKKWQPILDVKNPIYLSYLSPAAYEVIYQTLKNGTVIHEGTFRFNILQPYWKTWWFFTMILLTLLGIVFVILRLYVGKIRAKQQFELEQLDLEKNLAEAKLQNLTSQMNPHFTFNALNTVQGLILDDKKEDAYTYLAHFSNLFRKSIDFSSKTFNTFEEEITFLETYLKIESKRFNNQLDYQIDDSELEDRFYKIPAMILQPFVENAIKHGLLHKQGDKKLRIQFLVQQESIACVITDNGIGRKASGLLSQNRKNAHLNMATSSVQKRFDLYKKHHDMYMYYQYEDLMTTQGESDGTKVTITIPLMK
ncbi:MAG: histidine kinase [Bacteroidota bacterium]